MSKMIRAAQLMGPGKFEMGPRTDNGDSVISPLRQKDDLIFGKEMTDV